MKKTIAGLQKMPLKKFELTRKLRQALKQGNFKKAMKELNGLQHDLANLSKKSPRDLTPDEKKKLAELKKKLSQELASLGRDSKALSKLSSALSAASSQLNASNMSGAFDSLDLSSAELASLGSLADQMDLMQQTLDLVRSTKQDLGGLDQLASKPHWCPKCGKPKKPSNPWQKPGGT